MKIFASHRLAGKEQGCDQASHHDEQLGPCDPLHAASWLVRSLLRHSARTFKCHRVLRLAFRMRHLPMSRQSAFHLAEWPYPPVRRKPHRQPRIHGSQTAPHRPIQRDRNPLLHSRPIIFNPRDARRRFVQKRVRPSIPFNQLPTRNPQ